MITAGIIALLAYTVITVISFICLQWAQGDDELADPAEEIVLMEAPMKENLIDAAMWPYAVWRIIRNIF